MRPDTKTTRAGIVPKEDDPQQYATSAEVEKGLAALTDADLAKLMMIAASFCKQRHLAPAAIEPTELLSEAVLKTLECEDGKRWSKKVSLVKHLDRAMENISGHLVKQRTRIVAFSDGLQPDNEEDFPTTSPEDGMVEAENALSLLTSVFGDDLPARDVFAMRAEGARPDEIQNQLKMTPREYETINRRILRKIATFVQQTKV